MAMATNQQSEMLKASFDGVLYSIEIVKTAWTLPNLKELEEAIKIVSTTCRADSTYFINCRFKPLLDGVFYILETIESLRQKSDSRFESLKHAVIEFLAFICKTEPVRVSLRDDYRLVYILSDSFYPGQTQADLNLCLMETVSRGLINSWKVPQLKIIVRNMYTLVAENAENPSRSLSLALQILVNICLDNPSCALMARFDANHKVVMKHLKSMRKMQGNHTLELLCLHLILLYEPFLPSEIMRTGSGLISKCVTATIEFYNSNASGSFERVVNLFNIMTDFMKSFAKKIGPIVSRNGTSGSPIDGCLAPAEKEEKIIIESINQYLAFATNVLEQIMEFVRLKTDLNYKIAQAILDFTLTFIPSVLTVSANLSSYKSAMNLIEVFIKRKDKTLLLQLSCLRASLYVIEQVLGHRRDGVFEKLNFERHLHIILKNLKIYDDINPTTTQVNIQTFRIIRCLSYCGEKLGEESVQKLCLDTLRSLIKKLTEEKTLLENIRWNETICVIELLVTMSKYSSHSQILNTLISFTKTDKISQRIADCFLCGDAKSMKNALAVITAIAFQDDALMCVSESLVRSRNTPSEIKSSYPGTHEVDLSLQASNGAIALEQTLNSFAIVKSNNETIESEPNRGDLLALVKIKQEMHEFELSALHEQIKYHQKINAQLKLYMSKQSEILSKELCNSDNEELDRMQLQKLAINRQKEFNIKMSGIAKELDDLKAKIAEEQAREEELKNLLEMEKAARAEIEAKVESMEKVYAESVQKYKTLREDNKALKSDLQKTNKQLTESNTKITRLEESLKQKDDEAVQNRILFDNERRLMDTIRGVIGNNFKGN